MTAGEDTTGAPLALKLAPSGCLHLARGGEGPGAPAAAAEAIDAAFSSGTGEGLLHLASVEVDRELGPTLGYWREVAKLFLTKLSALLDLDDAAARGLEVPLEPGEVERFLASAPPMAGIEYLSGDAVLRAWDELRRAFLDGARASGKGAEAFLRERNPIWRSVGRVFFHLAENRARPDLPFAFLATYTSRISSRGKLQHVPLGRAVQEQASAGKTDALLSLLLPVQKAAARSALLKGLVESRRIFQPQAWTPADAHAFLREVPLYEEEGIFVRVPDWWNQRNPPRVQVGVTVGGGNAVGIGVEALLDFSVELSLEGEPITEEEWRRIAAGAGGLALVKGRWVEVDREKLGELLEHWKSVEEDAGRGGISFLKGMRLLARLPAVGEGGGDGDPAAERDARWVRVEAGDWLRGVLEDLRSPPAKGVELSGDELRTTLRPYQAEGVEWLRLLHRLRLGGCLADDMGLGKTIQVLGLLLLLKREPEGGRLPSLLVIPASLIGNWKAECARFAPSLRVLVAHPSEPGGSLETAPPGIEGSDLVITTYGMLARQPWMKDREWRLVVLDEAQAIKNPGARQTREVKQLRSLHRLALTGTPIENRLGDLWSLYDFLSPGLLGSAKEFTRLVKPKDERSATDIYGRVRALVRPYLLRRLKTDKRIIADLPEKEEVKVYCGLRKKQAVLYEEAVRELGRAIREAEGIQRRGVILAFLLRFKQICNHPSQWRGDGVYDPEESGKAARLIEICEEIASRQEKVLVFTQFREITPMLAGILEGVFGRPGPILDGSTPVKRRREIVEDFQREDGPPFFVLSLKAGGTGLNLTAASHVIHFDRWWNPAVEDQATDRAFRIGQRRNVLVHKFVSSGTVEERIDDLLESKRGIADEVLKEGAERTLTEMTNDELIRFVSMDGARALAEA